MISARDRVTGEPKTLASYDDVLLVQTAGGGDLPVDPDTLPMVFNWNVDGTLNYVEVTDGVTTWRQTYGYTSGAVTSISAWVAQ